MMQAARALVESEEFEKPPARPFARPAHDFARWSGQIELKPNYELAEQILEESAIPISGNRKSRRRRGTAGKPERVHSLDGRIPRPRSFLEHVSLVMDVAITRAGERCRS